MGDRSAEFAKQAEAYARHRPRYPEALLRYVASLAPGRRLAWDAATGNGQAAAALADSFEEVYASDAGAEQIRRAAPHPKVRYAVEPAEACSLPDGSADLVTCAQALHWLRLDDFYAQARRVLRPGGVLAAWAYAGSRTGEPGVDRLIDRFMRETVGPFWAPEVKLIWEGYRAVPFPFEEERPPAFAMEARWDLTAFLGYLRSWSAVQKYIDQRKEDPLPRLEEELRPAWGDPAARRAVAWDLALRVGRSPREG